MDENKQRPGDSAPPWLIARHSLFDLRFASYPTWNDAEPAKCAPCRPFFIFCGLEQLSTVSGVIKDMLNAELTPGIYYQHHNILTVYVNRSQKVRSAVFLLAPLVLVCRIGLNHPRQPLYHQVIRSV